MPPKAGSTRRTSARRVEDSETTPTTATQEESSSTKAPETRTPAPSATPGPAGRPSVQRLQSLKKRGGSGSISPAGRAPSALSGEAKPKLKVQPKNVGRRSKEERDALQKLEDERNMERMKEAAAIRGRADRGKRGSFRGRGGPVGMSGSGPLGSDTGFGRARRGRGGGGGGGGGGGPFGPGAGSGRDRTRSAFSGGSRPPVDEDSDEYESELRLDINHINDMDSDDDHEQTKDVKGKMPYRPKGEKGLKPYRVHRIEHEERVVSVNMESSSSRSAELRKQAEEEEAAGEGAPASGEAGTDGEPRVKKEQHDQDTTMVDSVPHAEDDGLLPAPTARVRRKVPPSPQKAKSTRKDQTVESPPKRDPRELLRTKEEIDEYDRYLEDLDHVRNMLYHESPTATTTEPQAEEPQAMDTTEGPGEGESEQQAHDKPVNPLVGQLFLMQFPPMTPNLINPALPTEQPPSTTEPAPSGTQNEVKLESNDPQIIDADHGPTETAKVITATADWSLPAGRVGKLNVHESGRVTMDWGGISFELDRAASVDFVQEALIVSKTKADEPGEPPREEETDRRVWSMGQLSGKFTVIPNWDQML